jgi:plasmid maintenance system antidote protein VapI
MEVSGLQKLQAFVAKFPTQKAAAEALGIKPAYLSDLVNMRRDLSDNILAKLRLKRVIVQDRG